MSIYRFLLFAGCGCTAAILASCAAPALYAPGFFSGGKASGIALDPPDQTGMPDDRWLVEKGIEVFHFSHGSGAPVLVVHGGPGVPFQASWKGLELIRDRTFVYYHQRGCGRSTVPIDRFDSRNYYQNMLALDRALGMAAQIADIERIRRILGVEKLVIIGHSYGGFIASLYAMEFPDRVEKMVLVAPAAVLALPPVDVGMDKVRDFLSEEGKKRYAEFEKEYFDYGRIFTRTENGLAELNARYGEFYGEALANSGVEYPQTPAAEYRPGGWVVHAIYMSLGQRYDYREQAAKIAAPVLVLHGERDLFPGSASRRYADLIPGAVFSVIPGASHFPFDERPEEFAKAVRAFIGK